MWDPLADISKVPRLVWQISLPAQLAENIDKEINETLESDYATAVPTSTKIRFTTVATQPAIRTTEFPWMQRASNTQKSSPDRHASLRARQCELMLVSVPLESPDHVDPEELSAKKQLPEIQKPSDN